MTKIKSIRLTFSEGSSDKEYNAQIIKVDSGYEVHFQYGRRGGTLQSGVKTSSPVELVDAEKVYNKIVKEKTQKGYIPDGESTEFVPAAEKESIGVIPQLLNPITEVELLAFINDESVGFQKKHDGERRLVFKKKDKASGGNRKGEAVALPAEIVNDLSEETDIELDGELIGSTVYVFDLLRHNGKDYKKESFQKRMEALSNIKFKKNLVVVETAFTKKDKAALLKKLKEENSEGIVIKVLSSKYTPSRPASGGVALKFKFYKTATVKVSSKTKGKRSVQVAVLEAGKFVDVGGVTIPPNFEVPSVGELVEVRYLYAYKGGSLYQPTYLGVRTDLDDADASIAQLEYKAE